MMLQKIGGFDFFPKLMIHDIEFNLQVFIILENNQIFLLLCLGISFGNSKPYLLI